MWRTPKDAATKGWKSLSLGRFLGTLVEDRHLELDDHAVAKVDVRIVLADLLEVVCEVELRTRQLDAAVGLDRREKIRGADRTVELLAVGRVGRDGERQVGELAGQLESGLLLLGGASGALGLKLLETALRGLRNDGGETLREEEVAGVAGGDRLYRGLYRVSRTSRNGDCLLQG